MSLLGGPTENFVAAAQLPHPYAVSMREDHLNHTVFADNPNLTFNMDIGAGRRRAVPPSSIPHHCNGPT